MDNFKFNFISQGQLRSLSIDSFFFFYSKCYHAMSIFGNFIFALIVPTFSRNCFKMPEGKWGCDGERNQKKKPDIPPPPTYSLHPLPHIDFVVLGPITTTQFLQPTVVNDCCSARCLHQGKILTNLSF